MMGGGPIPMVERLAIERGSDVPDAELGHSSRIRRRLFRGETLTNRQAMAEIGASSTAFHVVIADLRRLGFEVVRQDSGDRWHTSSYSLADPDYEPTAEAFDASRAHNAQRSRPKPPMAKDRRWITASEAARIVGTDNSNKIGKAWRAGKLRRRKPHPHNPRAYLYDRAEVE